MAYVRTVRTGSGATAVQIVHGSRCGSRDIEHLGSAIIGLIQQRALHQQDTLVEQLQHALDSRVLIEQAKGVLAERHHIDPAQAFTLLRTAARNHGQQLTELAAAVVDGAAGDLLGIAPSAH